MTSSLVGSEMCIRDRPGPSSTGGTATGLGGEGGTEAAPVPYTGVPDPVSYTHLTLPTICSV
eukprot:6730707-Prorocentrum_lima.AAC.1